MTLQGNVSSPERFDINTQTEGQSVDTPSLKLPDLLRLVRARRKIILGTAAIVLALATVIVFEMTPLYTATAVVMLDERKHNLEDSAAVLSGLTADQSTIQNQVQILTSRELAGRVVDQMGLMKDPEFNSSLSPLAKFSEAINPKNWFAASTTQQVLSGQSLERSAVLKQFSRRVSVDVVGLSTAIKVSFESESPEKAAAIVKAIANAYVEDQLEAKFQATQKATQWLAGRISELSKQTQLAEAAVQQYKAEHNITTTAHGVSVVEQQIADISGQLVTERANLAEKQADYVRLRALAQEGRAADSSQVLASPLIATLRGQEAQLTNEMANLSSKYGQRHPKILDIEARKANLDAKINEEVQRFVSSAKNDVDVASSHVASMEKSLHDAEQMGVVQNQANVQLMGLQSSAASARAMYEAMLGRLNQTQGQQGIQTPDARIISNPDVPRYASFPNKVLVIGLSVPGGLMLGFFLAFLLENMKTGFRTTSEVENALNVPVLSTIPEVSGSNKAPINPADLIIDKPLSAYAEAIRGVQLGLVFSNVDNPVKVIAVTSSGPGEGKSTLVVSLARSVARNGIRSVVVDGDLRRPRVAKSIGLTGEEKGITDYLARTARLEECLHKDPRSDAMVLPCTTVPPNPSDILTSHAMEELIKDLRTKFDYVFIDTAPLLPVNDTKLLGLLADAVLLVVQWEATPRDAVFTAMRTLSDVRTPIAGIALTRADNDRFRYYSYGHQNYYNYGKYYAD